MTPASTARGAASPTWTGPAVARGAILVALDEGRADRAALRWAVQQSRTTHRPLHLVHVLDDEVVADAQGAVLVPGADQLAHEAAAARARACSLAADLAPDARVSIAAGHLVPTLVAASRSAHLVVLGDTLLRASPQRPGQQVAVFLAMRARCPVVVVPGTGEPALGEDQARVALRRANQRASVVVGLDGHHAGRGALELAFAQASAHGAPLKVVHVWPPAEPGGAGGDRGWAQHRAMVSALLAGFRERHPDVLVVTHLIRGEAVAGLVGRSWRAELLVLSGCSGEGGTRLLPGAVTLGVLERARCPVAMVRDQEAGEHPSRPTGRAEPAQVALAEQGDLVRT